MEQGGLSLESTLKAYREFVANVLREIQREFPSSGPIRDLDWQNAKKAEIYSKKKGPCDPSICYANEQLFHTTRNLDMDTHFVRRAKFSSISYWNVKRYATMKVFVSVERKKIV